jgi:class 3 adenylate cyclase
VREDALVPPSDPIIKISEPGRTPLHLVVRRPIEVGRDCDGVLLADVELSRRHLRLGVTAGRVTVQDLGSTNGTTIDDNPIVGPTGVRAGEVVKFGRCTIEVVASNGAFARSASEDVVRQTSIDVVAGAAVASGSIPDAVPAGGTLTIVFSDIEQSTRRAVELGDERWLELIGFHNALIRRHVARYCGYEVKSQGDGFMLAFSSARSALLFSIDVMRALENHARSRPTDAVRIRVGMHTGEAIIEDGDLFGKPVVLASRIANQARGGEILVSSLVREIVESRGDLTFGESRRVELKGLSGEHTLHAVDWVKSRQET